MGLLLPAHLPALEVRHCSLDSPPELGRVVLFEQLPSRARLRTRRSGRAGHRMATVQLPGISSNPGRFIGIVQQPVTMRDLGLPPKPMTLPEMAFYSVVAIAASGLSMASKGRVGRYISIFVLTASGFFLFATAEEFFRHPGWEAAVEGATVSGRGAIFLLVAQLTNPLIMGVTWSFAGLALLTAARNKWLELHERPRTRIDSILQNFVGGVLHPIETAKEIIVWLKHAPVTGRGIALFCGALGLIGSILFLGATNRYEISSSAALYRIDRLSGSVEPCFRKTTRDEDNRLATRIECGSDATPQ